MGFFDRWRRRDAFGVPAERAPREVRPAPWATAHVQLEDWGTGKIQVIKLVREAGGLSLRDAKDLVEGAPSRIPVAPDRAAELVRELEAAGATAHVA